ncbi:MAG: hypothetical protein F7C32_00625 [Desulfurococcales archaeon]|nr:hypothetical protein [Desulfurococcales archaeon]
MTFQSEVGVICPRCKNVMVYQMETEINGNEKTLRRYYRCPVCGYRINDMSALSHNGDGRVKIIVKWMREWNNHKDRTLAVIYRGRIGYLKT